MIELNFYEFLLLWGLYGIIFLCGIGLGYAWGILTKTKKEENTNGRTEKKLLDEA